jgi:hypothetical protein
MGTMPAKAVTKSTWYVGPAPMGSRLPAAIHVSFVSKTVVATMHALSRAFSLADLAPTPTRVSNVRKAAAATVRACRCAFSLDNPATAAVAVVAAVVARNVQTTR